MLTEEWIFLHCKALASLNLQTTIDFRPKGNPKEFYIYRPHSVLFTKYTLIIKNPGFKNPNI